METGGFHEFIAVVASYSAKFSPQKSFCRADLTTSGGFQLWIAISTLETS